MGAGDRILGSMLVWRQDLKQDPFFSLRILSWGWEGRGHEFSHLGLWGLQSGWTCLETLAEGHMYEWGPMSLPSSVPPCTSPSPPCLLA